MVVHHVDPSPVDGDDHVVLGQVGTFTKHTLNMLMNQSISVMTCSFVQTRVSESLVEPGEEQRPLVLGVADHVLLGLQRRHVLLHVVTLEKKIFISQIQLLEVAAAML